VNINLYSIRKKKAFTIAEMLIALSILVIISAMVAVIFRATQQSFTNARAFQDVIELARQTIFRIPLAGISDGDMCEVGYWQHTDGNLMRHLETDPDYDFQTVDADSELGLIISNLNFTYFDGDTYQDSWDTRRGEAQEHIFPKAVKISFSISDETNIAMKEFETTVRIASSYH